MLLYNEQRSPHNKLLERFKRQRREGSAAAREGFTGVHGIAGPPRWLGKLSPGLSAGEVGALARYEPGGPEQRDEASDPQACSCVCWRCGDCCHPPVPASPLPPDLLQGCTAPLVLLLLLSLGLSGLRGTICCQGVQMAGSPEEQPLKQQSRGQSTRTCCRGWEEKMLLNPGTLNPEIGCSTSAKQFVQPFY